LARAQVLLIRVPRHSTVETPSCPTGWLHQRPAPTSCTPGSTATTVGNRSTARSSRPTTAHNGCFGAGLTMTVNRRSWPDQLGVMINELLRQRFTTGRRSAARTTPTRGSTKHLHLAALLAPFGPGKSRRLPRRGCISTTGFRRLAQAAGTAREPISSCVTIGISRGGRDTFLSRALALRITSLGPVVGGQTW